MRNLGVICLAMFSCAFGQEKKVEESRLTLMALGSLPPYEVLLLNPPQGKRFLPGDLPPADLSLKNAEGAFKGIELRLNKASKFSSIPKGEVEVPIFEGPRRDGKAWANLEIPETGKYLGLVVRSQKPKKPSWEKVDAFVLKDDGKSFPEGSMRIFNASSSNIALKIGERKALMIPAKESLLVKQLQAPVLLKVAKREEGGVFKLVYSNQARELKEGERVSVFVYEDKEARRGLKVFLSYDLAPKGN